MHSHLCTKYVQLSQNVTLLTDIYRWENVLVVQHHLKESFFATLGDVLDLDFIFGGIRGKQFLLTAASNFPVAQGYF